MQAPTSEQDRERRAVTAKRIALEDRYIEEYQAQQPPRTDHKKTGRGHHGEY